MTIKFNFFANQQKENHQKWCKVYEKYSELVESNVDFDIDVDEDKKGKSHSQLKAVYKLFQKSLPHFKKWKPTIKQDDEEVPLDWNLDGVKEYAKTELGYTRPPTILEIAMRIKMSGINYQDETEKNNAFKFYSKSKINLSFADFSKEQIYNFTMDYQVWAQTPIFKKGKEIKPAWQDVYLESEEKQAMLEYYNKKEG
jgi:hypothetical protein